MNDSRWLWLGLCSLVFGLCASLSHAQGTKADYERAESYRSRVADCVFADVVNPQWFGQEDAHFWYRLNTAPKSHQFVLVDCEQGVRREAFDHAHLAGRLAEVTNRSVSADRLDLESLSFSEELTECSFRFAEKSWVFGLPRGPLTEDADETIQNGTVGLRPQVSVARSSGGDQQTTIRFENRLGRRLEYFWVMEDGGLRSYGRVGPGASASISTFAGHAWLLKDRTGRSIASFIASLAEQRAIIDESTVAPSPWQPASRKPRDSRRGVSPDGQFRVMMDSGRLTIQDRESGVTTIVDAPEIDGVDTSALLYKDRVWWSPDSTCFFAMRYEPGENRSIHLIESSPKDSHHARLLTVPYAKPGDKLDRPYLVVVSRYPKWQARHIDQSEFPNPFDLRDFSWNENGDSFSFLYNERGHQRLRLITVDPKSASPRVAIDEQSETFICYSRKSFLHRVEASGELIWMSERSGWNHLYLIDAATGNVKNPITSGSWVVREVERTDDANRQIYLKVSGIDPGQDPYHEHLVRVDYDGSKLTRLTQGDGNHRWKFSPSGKFMIDTYSRVDLPPVSVLRESSGGKKICDLEQADISRLTKQGWKPPQRFVAKGRDGETEIHGIIVRPTHFQEGKSYPVLEHIYAGPHSSFVPKSFGTHRNLYEMAELGFIVVKMDGMGTSNRSKAFHDVCWKNLGDSGFPDRIAWIQAAAEIHSEMDLDRVGIWGGSAGGQSAMRALIAHGDFYHAAVADCGCHDNRVDKIWWNEQWMGWPLASHYEDQSNASQAHRLQGDLMLIWGELDQNVDPASTMQVIDALIRADKDFEQLVVPGAGHGAAGHPYAKRRQADFFVRKLWGNQPRSE